MDVQKQSLMRQNSDGCPETVPPETVPPETVPKLHFVETSFPVSPDVLAFLWCLNICDRILMDVQKQSMQKQSMRQNSDGCPETVRNSPMDVQKQSRNSPETVQKQGILWVSAN